jgi:hypothetical protein
VAGCTEALTPSDATAVHGVTSSNASRTRIDGGLPGWASPRDVPAGSASASTSSTRARPA